MDRERAEATVEKAVKNGQSRADGYNAFGAGAFMQAQYAIAAWGALKAATLDWDALHAANVGVYLFYLNRLDEADSFLGCAGAMNPQSPFILEAQALVAFRRKDCAGATGRIERVVPMLPGDMNVRYTAGVIFYRCGDRAKAVQHLRAALDRRPGDKTVTQALKIVDPTGVPPAKPATDAIHRQIEECLRFMDETLARAESVYHLYKQLDRLMGMPEPLLDEEIDNLRRHVASSKKSISEREVSYAREGSRQGPEAWNGLLGECIQAYLITITDYWNLWSLQRERNLVVMAESMRIAPLSLAQSLRNGYLFQGELDKYEDRGKQIWQGYQACENQCPYSPREALLACREGCKQAYCAEIVPVWQAFTSKVQANMNAAEDGFPRAARAYADYWLAYAIQAESYSKRTLAAMKFTGKVSPIDQQRDSEFWLRSTKHSYKSYIGEGVVRNAVAHLSSLQQVLQQELVDTPRQIVAIRSPVADCEAKSPPPLSLADALQQLGQAFNAATEYDAGFQPPECELELGPWSVTVKPFGEQGFEVERSQAEGPWSVSASKEGERWGVSVSASKDISSEGAIAEVGATAWGEAGGGRKADYGVTIYTKAGVGMASPDGEGKVACYFMSGEVNINARILMEELAR